MKLNTVVELPTGAIKFNGELTPEETSLVVELGFNFLVRSGAFNVTDMMSRTNATPERVQ